MHGKTSVLVERIINKVVNQKIDIDKLLVVTFTNAAASEMKQRLLEAIYKKIDENPNDENLQKQVMLLNRAHISTIHSFCLDVIRNNFFEIGMPANFRVADQTEIEIMKQDVLEKIFEEKYENQDENFFKLLELYTTYKDDAPLKNIILNTYDFSNNMPKPLEWLKEKINEFKGNGKFENTIWGKIIINDAKEQIDDMIYNLKEAVKLTQNNAELTVFYEQLSKDLSDLSVINSDSLDSIYQVVSTKAWDKWSSIRKMSEESKELKQIAKVYRDDAKKAFDVLKSRVTCSGSDAIMDINKMYPILKAIESLVIEFDKNIKEEKKEKNIVDFSDIEHLALKILVDDNDNPTEIAKKYDFEEIAIDEYQDSNLVQEKILNSVSNGKNIFMVGDVKQSIYRFRGGRPDLFLNKYDTYQKIEDEKELTSDTKIQLYNNFRSRKEVIDITNLVFENIMSKKLGEIEYTEEEYLNFSANFEEPKIDCTAELCIIEMDGESDFDETSKDIGDRDVDNASEEMALANSNEDNEEGKEIIEKEVLEARLVAKKIKEFVEQGYKYRDCAILLRSTAHTAPIYEKELTKQGIPVFSDTASEYLETIEIDTIISLLKIIDNPLQDIPLVTVLRSPIGGFTDDELLEVRLEEDNCPFFKALQKASERAKEQLNANKVNDLCEQLTYAIKALRFIQMLEEFKSAEKILALDELIWKIYSDTGYYHYVRLMPNGKLRQANLRKLFEKAKDYEKISFKGLFNFITFMERISASKSGIAEAKIIGENDDVVRIMSIHKSKGLEFPICFICNAEKEINLMDLNDKIVYDQEVGIGVQYISEEAEYKTLTKEAINIKMKNETISEEMRVLYVALTRAKEKLIIIAADRNIDSNMNSKRELINKYYPVERPPKMSSKLPQRYIRYLDWLELVYIYNNGKYMNLEIINKSTLEDVDSSDYEVEISKLLDSRNVNVERYNEIDSLLNWKYEFEKSVEAPTKTSVTALKQKTQNKDTYKKDIERPNDFDNIESEERLQKTNNKEYIAKVEEINEEFTEKIGEKPNKITGARLGTLIHLAMQKMSLVQNPNIDELIDNLKINDDEKKALLENKEMLEKYTKSNLYQDLLKAKKVYRETPFYMDMPYVDTGEKVLIQGIIDMYYINEEGKIILIDYKTDRAVSEEILKERYDFQLKLYKDAIEKPTHQKVDKVYIYSTYLNKEVQI